MQAYKTLRLILGDQLNPNHSWFQEEKEGVLYVFMEIKAESEYVKHHIQKIVGIFLGMRSMAEELKSKGFHTHYIAINDPDNHHSFEQNIKTLIARHHIENFEFQEPDEYRLDELLDDLSKRLTIPYRKYSAEHFFTERDELSRFFEGKKTFLMESFYRQMRKKYNILMDGKGPITGKWNYDHENRKKLPKNHFPPNPIIFQHDVSTIVEQVKKAGLDLDYIGTCDPQQFIWTKNRKEALEVLDFFIQHLLSHFGTYQDALSNEFWSMYHSRISFALNTKMLSPVEVVQAVESYWQEHQQEVSIAQAEGYIRQIVGWREYMRGIYWAKMPNYASLNFFGHTRKLPDYFWTGDTNMNCVQKAVKQSLQYAYAHHIQRLMVTGNFALLAGIDPDQVDLWYLGIYIDAFEWVEITNTRGMSQFADGGIVGTKPYISSAAYIHKMGNHCSTCFYKQKEKTGERSCPFNSLYWHFIEVNKPLLAKNPRMSMMYRTWEKMGEKQKAILEQANIHLENIETL